MGKRLVSILGEQSGRVTASMLLVTLVVTMVLAGALASTAKAATLSSVSDTITSSAPGAATSHVLAFTTITTIATAATTSITFDSNFNMNSITCADVSSAILDTCNITGHVVSFSLSSGSVAPGAHTVTIGNTVKILNPSTANTSYQITIATPSDTGSTWDAIVPQVELTADVNSYFQFVVHGVAAGTCSDGTESISTDVTSTDTSVPFGTLAANTPVTLASKLTARTNAADGFIVSIEQNHDMTASSGATIDTFQDGTPPGAGGAVWASPTHVSGTPTTYGHQGFQSTDYTDGPNTAGNWFGLQDGHANAVTVFAYGSPTAGGAALGGTDVSGQNAACVGYRTEISDLQEPGHYESRVMYIGTATF